MHNNAGYQPAYQPAGYQPAGQTTVVVVPAAPRMRGPTFLQQGVRVGGLMLGLSCVACLGMFGIFFLFVATIMLATANYDDEFWDDFDRDNDPTVVVGSIFMVIGLLLTGACVAICYHARKKYNKFGEQSGRVINPNPGGYVPQPQSGAYQTYPQQAGYPGQPQPSGYSGQPQPAGYPGQPQPAGYPGQPQPAGYPGQPQPAGYPAQPQPYAAPGQPQPSAAYPGQPQAYPQPTTSYPGPPAPYPAPAGDPTVQVDPSYPVKPQQTNMPYEYSAPPPHVPASDVPSAPPPYRP